MLIPFVKMHGLGNDYIYIDDRAEDMSDPSEVARVVSNRHRGIGGDGIILIRHSQDADIQMRMFNADGSEAEMCGNGIRCLAKYVVDRHLVDADSFVIETKAGNLAVTCEKGQDQTVKNVTVSMGEPVLVCEDIPAVIGNVHPRSRIVNHAIDLSEFGFDPHSIRSGGVEPFMTLVSMGNPHAIVYCEDVSAVHLSTVGPRFEVHPAFPNRMNLHLVEVVGPHAITMRTWERGSGITEACGTGACAACVAGILSERHLRKVEVTLPGGVLHVKWPEAHQEVQMRGSATEVFEGHIEI